MPMLDQDRNTYEEMGLHVWCSKAFWGLPLVYPETRPTVWLTNRKTFNFSLDAFPLGPSTHSRSFWWWRPECCLRRESQWIWILVHLHALLCVQAHGSQEHGKASVIVLRHQCFDGFWHWAVVRIWRSLTMVSMTSLGTSQDVSVRSWHFVSESNWWKPRFIFFFFTQRAVCMRMWICTVLICSLWLWNTRSVFLITC